MGHLTPNSPSLCEEILGSNESDSEIALPLRGKTLLGLVYELEYRNVPSQHRDVWRNKS
jgi:hypothetical protein